MKQRRRWPVICAGIVATLGVAIGALLVWSPGYAPFDDFKVLSVLPDPTNKTYAAVVRYHHGNSSATVTAVWIGQGPPPSIGSSHRFVGEPSFISPGDSVSLKWRPGGRLAVTIPSPVEISGYFGDCYFNLADVQNLACANLEEVDIVISNQIAD
ncbi:hypothetical protein [Dongia sp.]|uniref:hypothetical protein n=1 Tax=Dongia sp. TaxID=1977262 RepID=UPI0035B3063E